MRIELEKQAPRHIKSATQRMERSVRSTLFKCWNMVIVANQLFDGRRFRALTIVDNFSRYCMDIHAGRSIKGKQVVQILKKLQREWKTRPNRIQVDNGPEFISKDLDRWAYENEVSLDFSRPGKPTDNAYIESLRQVPILLFRPVRLMGVVQINIVTYF